MAGEFMLMVFLKLLLMTLQLQATPPKVALRVVTMEYPPFMLQTPTTQGQGLLVDILKAALRKSDFQIDLQFYPLKRAVLIMHDAEKNSWPVSLNSAEHFKEEITRGKIKAVQMGTASFYAFVRNTDKSKFQAVQSLADLKNLKVAAPRGSAIIPHLRKQNIVPLEVASFDQLFQVLEFKRVDVAVVLGLSGDALIESQSLQKSFMRLPSPLLSVSMDLLVPSGHPQAQKLIQTLHTNLSQMKQSGELAKIARRYFGKWPIPPFFDKTK
jgi:ABC-type amino acid transport substrate-binding protein